MQPELHTRSLRILRHEGLWFKDHDSNGRIDAFEDWRRPPLERAMDLLSRMTLQEKIGEMLHANAPTTNATDVPGMGTSWNTDALHALLHQRCIGAFLNRLQAAPKALAQQSNLLQAMAERRRLGIPAMLSSDPRSHFNHSQGVSVGAGSFTRWPEPAGLAAAGSTQLVQTFADSAREEYLAVGLRMALSPMADLALQPRWHRCNGTFGSDPSRVSAFVRAYVEGMQGGREGPTPRGVACVVKHWAGYGATAPDGFDAHNHYGRHMAPGVDGLEPHLRAFTGAFHAEVAGVMPAYSVPPPGLEVEGADGALEPVGIAFNRPMLRSVLRGRFGFDGLVMSDWHVTDDVTAACRDGAAAGQSCGPADIAMPWGVEHLPRRARWVKAVEAGIDQFGGADDPQWLLGAVRDGALASAAIDRAALRSLLPKFRLGLFENPFVDEELAEATVGRPALQARAMEAQRRSVVLLKHRPGVLPVRAPRRLYLRGIDPVEARCRGFEIVARPQDAQLALVGLVTPHERPHPNHFFGSRYREGDTGFREDDAELHALRDIASQVPVVAIFYLERPADLTRVVPHAAAIVGHWGVHPAALWDVLTGESSPTASLPFDLPWTGPQRLADGLALRRGQGLHF